jgi:hypothetical protein
MSDETDVVVETLAQIAGNGFSAGIVLWDDIVIEAAPIVHFMKKQKWSRAKVREYCAAKRWRVTVVHQTARTDTRYRSEGT